MLEYKYPIALIQWKEGTYALQVSETCGMVWRFHGAIPTADFARVVRASRGAHRRPLHPRLASLCSAFKTASAAESAACEAQPAKSTAAPSDENSEFDDLYR
jgi:hypothetical protein